MTGIVVMDRTLWQRLLRWPPTGCRVYEYFRVEDGHVLPPDTDDRYFLMLEAKEPVHV